MPTGPMPSCCARCCPRCGTTFSIASSAPSLRRKSPSNQALSLWKRFLAAAGNFFWPGSFEIYRSGTGIALPPLSDATLPTRPIARPREIGGGLPASGGSFQIGYREQPRRIGPGAVDGEAAAARQRRHAVIVVLVGILGMDPLALREGEAAARDGHGLRAQALEVDLDTAFSGVVDGLVGEARKVEIGLELAVHAAQQIERELGGDAGLVVVGVVQAAWILFEIDPHHQRAGRSQERTGAAQEGGGLGGLEIADGRAREKAEPRRTVHLGRQLGERHVVGADRLDIQARVIAAQPCRRSIEMLARDVDRHIGREIAKPLEQQARLYARAAAEFDQRAAGAGQYGKLADALAQNPGLGAREVIFG